jgi:hypothetical protein
MQPDWISVSSNKLIYIDSINGGRSLDSPLLTVYKNGYVFLLPSSLLSLLGGCQFAFGFCIVSYALSVSQRRASAARLRRIRLDAFVRHSSSIVIMSVTDSISEEKTFLFVPHMHGIHFEISRTLFSLPE